MMCLDVLIPGQWHIACSASADKNGWEFVGYWIDQDAAAFTVSP
jgi:hypothetical protein